MINVRQSLKGLRRPRRLFCIPIKLRFTKGRTPSAYYDITTSSSESIVIINNAPDNTVTNTELNDETPLRISDNAAVNFMPAEYPTTPGYGCALIGQSSSDENINESSELLFTSEDSVNVKPTISVRDNQGAEHKFDRAIIDTACSHNIISPRLVKILGLKQRPLKERISLGPYGSEAIEAHKYVDINISISEIGLQWTPPLCAIIGTDDTYDLIIGKRTIDKHRLLQKLVEPIDWVKVYLKRPYLPHDRVLALIVSRSKEEEESDKDIHKRRSIAAEQVRKNRESYKYGNISMAESRSAFPQGTPSSLSSRSSSSASSSSASSGVFSYTGSMVSQPTTISTQSSSNKA